MHPIIDCHCHIYPDKIAAKATESIGKFYSLPMAYGGTAREVLEKSREAGITHSVIFSVATTPKQVQSINEFIGRETALEPCFTGLGAVHPESPDIRSDIEQLISLGLKGVKTHPDFQGFGIDDHRFMKIYELCAENNLTVLIHMGDPRYDYSSPARLINVLKEMPGLKVIGAHLGGWGVWKKAQEQLSSFENLYVDCSSSLAFMPSDECRDIIKAYGSKRVLFGTDYPMWDFKKELERFYAMGLSDDENQDILYRNSAKVFDIDI